MSYKILLLLGLLSLLITHIMSRPEIIARTTDNKSVCLNFDNRFDEYITHQYLPSFVYFLNRNTAIIEEGEEWAVENEEFETITIGDNDDEQI
jgi:hypothetical protein